MSENPNPEKPQEGKDPEQEQTFSQADVDRIVADRLKRERETTKAKYADYDDLKTRAEGAKTLEDRVAEIEARAVKAEAEALRSRVAAEFGISTKRGEKGEPSDADLFLTGTDKETLTAQAKRLADRESERTQNGNHVPTEGNNPQPSEDPQRAWARSLFASAGE